MRGTNRPSRPPQPKKPPPSKYKYEGVTVRFWKEKFYNISDIREAVELLRYAPDTKATGLIAHATVDVGRDWPMNTNLPIPFKEIEGKNLKQLMRMLDDRLDAILEREKQKWYEKNDKNERA